MQLNCDLGESFGAWQMGDDAQVMPYIDMANIACGFHAGDPVVIAQTLALAKQHNVSVGAHPSYPDLPGFGRRSMQLTSAQLVANWHYQIAALEGMAKTQGLVLHHVKAHGALYNDMMTNPELLNTLLEATATYSKQLIFVLQATPQYSQHQKLAQQHGIAIMFEAFCDRQYESDGTLMNRRKAGAVLGHNEMLAQVERMVTHHQVITATGTVLSLPIDTLCVHGDNETGVLAIPSIRKQVHYAV